MIEGRMPISWRSIQALHEPDLDRHWVRCRDELGLDCPLEVFEELFFEHHGDAEFGALIQETVWLGDIPVATLRPNGAQFELFYVHTDHLNTPRLVSRPSDNAVRWRWDSDPFGKAVPNENPSGLGVFKHNLRFPGQQYDGMVGLYYNYFRDYDAATGRYVQSDPIGLAGGLNPYAYAESSPPNYSDPLGLAAFPILPRTADCKLSEWKVCETRCAPAAAKGCYVTIKWKLRGIRAGEPLRSEERTVNCRCDEPCPSGKSSPDVNKYWWIPLIPLVTPWPDPY